MTRTALGRTARTHPHVIELAGCAVAAAMLTLATHGVLIVVAVVVATAVRSALRRGQPWLAAALVGLVLTGELIAGPFTEVLLMLQLVPLIVVGPLAAAVIHTLGPPVIARPGRTIPLRCAPWAIGWVLLIEAFHAGEDSLVWPVGFWAAFTLMIWTLVLLGRRPRPQLADRDSVVAVEHGTLT